MTGTDQREGDKQGTHRMGYEEVGVPKTSVLPYLNSIAEELNGRPRATLGYLTHENPSNDSYSAYPTLHPRLDTAET